MTFVLALPEKEFATRILSAFPVDGIVSYNVILGDFEAELSCLNTDKLCVQTMWLAWWIEEAGRFIITILTLLM
jgi:hypothetical protein